MRFFNTAGPVNPEDHYCLPPLNRLDLDEILLLIEQKKYFVLHAPRQTGKTSLLLAWRNYLNQVGKYQALYINIEPAQALREDVDRAMMTILSVLTLRAELDLGHTFLNDVRNAIREENTIASGLYRLLTLWAERVDKPIVLFIDEIDSLIGDSLISTLRQLRAGYDQRPHQFPQSIILCGVRDVRDYRIHSSSEKAIITGGRAFNVKAESLHMGNFNQTELQALYQQHTDATGQIFTLVIWFYSEDQMQEVVLALKIRYGKREKTIDKGLAQTWQYMDQCGTSEGHLIIFDRAKDKSWEEKIFREERGYKGQTIVVWGM